MMSPHELREICQSIRSAQAGELAWHPVSDELATRIEAEVQKYRGFLAEPRSQRPPHELAERLPLMGWLLLEASLSPLWRVGANFEALSGPKGEVSRREAALISRLADAARALPWPEFAPRALGAIRALALAESKRDTPAGYDAAWTLHQEARNKYESFVEYHGDEPAPARLDLDEVLLQLALAETGTACRTAEQIIGQWAERWENEDSADSEEESKRWTLRLFRQLSEGAEVGELALRTARRIGATRGFVHRVDEHRLALVTSFRNPAIMTCRALLLMYSMCPEMDKLGKVPHGYKTWTDYQAGLLVRFDEAIRDLRHEVLRADGSTWSLINDHARSMVQICLHLALITPGHSLEEELKVDDDLRLHRLDDAAVTAMCKWLGTVIDTDGKPRGDANIIGSASKPSFIRSVEDCRKDLGSAADYRGWRREWFKLDRYAGQPGREERINRILDDA